jgi:cell division septal protein FtsQ
MATKCNIINLQKQTQKELEEETPLVNKLKQQQQQKDSNFSYLDLRKSTEPSVKMPRKGC